MRITFFKKKFGFALLFVGVLSMLMLVATLATNIAKAEPANTDYSDDINVSLSQAPAIGLKVSDISFETNITLDYEIDDSIFMNDDTQEPVTEFSQPGNYMGGVLITLTKDDTFSYNSEDWSYTRDIQISDKSVKSLQYTIRKKECGRYDKDKGWFITDDPARSIMITFTFQVSDEPQPTTEYEIICDNDGHGTLSASATKAAQNTEISLTPQPAYGYEFGYYETFPQGLAITNDKFIMPGQNVNIKAHFNKKITLNMDTASQSFLARANMEISDGADWRKKIESVPAAISLPEAENYYIGFTINRKYFIPRLLINDQEFQTVDWGGATEETTNIGVKLDPDFFSEESEYTINLTVDCQPNINYLETTTGLDDVQAKYTMMSDGEEIMNDENYTVSLDDANSPAEIDNAVASYGIEVSNDDEIITETDSDFDFTLTLDADKFTAEDYGVVREHEGQLEEIESDYDLERGELRFSSDKFSTYTIVEKAVEPVNPDNPGAEEANAESAQTGDMTFAIVAGLCIIAIAAGTTLAIRKRRANN